MRDQAAPREQLGRRDQEQQRWGQPVTVATNDIDLNAIPAQLRAIPHWIGWNWDERDGKRTKLPKAPGQRKCAKVNDPSTWRDFPTAAGHIEAHDGLGFVISEGDGLVGIDFDDILVDGTVVEWAKPFVEMLSARTYGEESPSGNGLKFICRAKKPFARCRRKGIGVELYSKNRFFTITGRAVDPDVCIVADAQDVVDDLFKFTMAPRRRGPQRPREVPERGVTVCLRR